MPPTDTIEFVSFGPDQTPRQLGGGPAVTPQPYDPPTTDYSLLLIAVAALSGALVGSLIVGRRR